MVFGSERYYRSSGAAPASGVILAIAVGSLAGAVLGTLYGLLDWFNPYIKLTFLGAFFAAAGTGFVAMFSLSLGKIRNRIVGIGIGATAGLVAIYSAWVVFLYFWSKEIFGQGIPIFRPDHILLTMREIAQVGLWENMPKGGGLYTMWIVEAAIFIGGSILISGLHDSPFCERCNCWADKNECGAGLQVPHNLAELKQDLEDEQYSRLHELMQGGADAHNYLKLTVHMCPNCDESTWLNIEQHLTTENAKGESNTSTTAVVKNLHIPRDLANDLVSAIPGATGGAEAILTGIPESERNQPGTIPLAGDNTDDADDDEDFWNTKKS